MLRNSHSFARAAQLVVVGQDLTSQSRYCYLPCPAPPVHRMHFMLCVCVCVCAHTHACVHLR